MMSSVAIKGTPDYLFFLESFLSHKGLRIAKVSADPPTLS
jgi:hypothetical protein